METIFQKNKIIEFESFNKTFELWKKYVTDEVLTSCSENEKNKTKQNNNNNNESRNNKIRSKLTLKLKPKLKQKLKSKSIKNFDKYVHKWGEINFFRRHNNYNNNEKFEYGNNKKLEEEKEKKQYNHIHNNYDFDSDNSSAEKKKKEFLLHYISVYEEQLEKLSKDPESYYSNEGSKEEENGEACIVTYENYINRNVNITTYTGDIQFLKFFYSSICLIKENKVLIPCGHYLYELIYPQTVYSFPLINKLNYYFVKLYINNSWYLVFVDLTLPYDEKNELISCYSLNEREIWTHILMKALYKCFHVFRFSNYHFFIIEMLTGLKYINTSAYSINHTLYNNKNIIKSILMRQQNDLSDRRNLKSVLVCDKENYPFVKEAEKKAASEGNVQSEEVITTSNERINDMNKGDSDSDSDGDSNGCCSDNHGKGDHYVSTRDREEQENSFYFLICPFEDKEHLKVKCENMKPRNCIKLSEYLINKKKKDILKGYKYIDNQGHIIIFNAELVPVENPAFYPNDSEGECSDSKTGKRNMLLLENKKTTNVSSGTNDGTNNISCNNKSGRKYSIIINENVENVLKMFKEILSLEQRKLKHSKNINEDSDNKNIKCSSLKQVKRVNFFYHH
ncbi:conserved Plasmodium protein, unknown function [Plasmodium malariae]|uniref:Calpain catalytic domain-containing protein n=1 Tax=Plasmodium malariae TaxID=5858 RepID=A0A1A8X796_PLAMA|nr:conserved Plasmodium protein, unknown function [Plasmodium malariae]